MSYKVTIWRPEPILVKQAVELVKLVGIAKLVAIKQKDVALAEIVYMLLKRFHRSTATKVSRHIAEGTYCLRARNLDFSQACAEYMFTVGVLQPMPAVMSPIAIFN